MKVNVNLSNELKIMQKKLQTLQSENMNLRRQATSGTYPVSPTSEYPDADGHVSLIRRPSARCGGGGNRPMSMYETGSAQKPYLLLDAEETFVASLLQPFPPHATKLEKQSSLQEGDYDNAVPTPDLDEKGLGWKPRQRGSAFRHGEGSLSEGKNPDAIFAGAGLPGTEDVIRKTEQITKNIQELLRAAQENKHDRATAPKIRCCFGTLTPTPLTFRPPDTVSWYSGLCPCLPGTVDSSFSLSRLAPPSHLFVKSAPL
ncbi:ARF GTPase-activating protein GIT2-like [Sceloporus undulatus]|uniref:ARF GTPase-activating protein GIT2-like n=1 Tax=Sceloporus undulatus TaxID=8520 RepID=UPI001C4CA3E9|nr:ARF GTPase-activating protein GIT2-like [Sceloporus undulatus]